MEDEASVTVKGPRTTTYTVQARQVITEGVGGASWRDVGTVELPIRSHRRTAILKVAPGKVKAGDILRVLDEDAAAEFMLVKKPAPPVADEYDVVPA